MKTLFATALIAALSFNAAASSDVDDSKWSVGLEKGIFTTHVSERYDGEAWNEDNHLYGLEVRKGDWAVQYSQFINSYGFYTWSIGFDYTAIEWNNFQVGVGAGLVDGYNADRMPACINERCVYVVGSVAYKYELTEAVSITPTVRVFGPAIIGSIKLSYEF